MHLSGYQARDIEVVDYHMYELPGTGLQFRGPMIQLSANQEYFSCIGAAQTFGCFCELPYPDLLANQLSVPALNLGYGGAGPEFFALQESLLDYVNRGKFAIIQVMSGRSQSNSLYACDGLEFMHRRSDGAPISARDAYAELLAGPKLLQRVIPGRAGREIAILAGKRRTKRIVLETCDAWVNSFQDLLSKITVPKILFWFSKREPCYRRRWNRVPGLFGEFPHLIDEPMLQKIRGLSDIYVQCVTDRGSPQLLVSRHTGQPVTVDPGNDRPDLRHGKPWTHDRYYPSPEMHVDAASALLESCRTLLTTNVSQKPHTANQ